MKAYKVYALKDGTVIDHIPRWKGMIILELLGFNEQKQFVTLGIGLKSKRAGWKDVVKIEHREISAEDAQKIALIAPEATLNIIRNHVVHKKIQLSVPDEVNDIVECKNPKCITNNELVATRFLKIADKPLALRCYYCERVFTDNDITLR
ncbi:MAG: aspartate carbamoyltransferase regulatory subunit [Patescibacteria group bacterium]|jgi:aspartate carbamoyltransferase regulatory subunit